MATISKPDTDLYSRLQRGTELYSRLQQAVKEGCANSAYDLKVTDISFAPSAKHAKTSIYRIGIEASRRVDHSNPSMTQQVLDSFLQRTEHLISLLPDGSTIKEPTVESLSDEQYECAEAISREVAHRLDNYCTLGTLKVDTGEVTYYGTVSKGKAELKEHAQDWKGTLVVGPAEDMSEYM